MQHPSGPGVSVGSVRGVALRPRGQVAPLGVLLLAFRVGATTVELRPAGGALLWVAHPSSSAGVHHTTASDRVTGAVRPYVTAQAEMIEARARPRARPRGVHDRGGGGGGRWWWMDVMKVS